MDLSQLKNILSNYNTVETLMQSAVDRNLITLKKIASLTNDSQIDTTRDQIDEFKNTWFGLFHRYMSFDSRERSIQLLRTKYNDVRELIELIIESGKLRDQLPSISNAIIASKNGLEEYKNNPRYISDKAMSANLDFLLENQIPTLLAMINVNVKLSYNVEASSLDGKPSYASKALPVLTGVPKMSGTDILPLCAEKTIAERAAALRLKNKIPVVEDDAHCSDNKVSHASTLGFGTVP